MSCPSINPTVSAEAEVELRARNLLFLVTPKLWPDWPFLPLVRCVSGGKELGLLFDCSAVAGKEAFATRVFLANLFLLPPTPEEFFALPTEAFASAEEIYAAGWRVD